MENYNVQWLYIEPHTRVGPQARNLTCGGGGGRAPPEQKSTSGRLGKSK